jgi:hypothetical protein
LAVVAVAVAVDRATRVALLVVVVVLVVVKAETLKTLMPREEVRGVLAEDREVRELTVQALINLAVAVVE